MPGPRQFAALTRVGSALRAIDRRPSPFGLLGRRYEPTPTKGDTIMARTQKTQPAAPKTPDFIAYHVLTKGEKTFWNRVGASWLHHDGNGMSLQLETVPVDGRIVLRAPLPANEDGARA
jgi:hypothetical protein